MAQSRWIALVVCAYGIACSGGGGQASGGNETTLGRVDLALQGHGAGDRDDGAHRKKKRGEGCLDDETKAGADAGVACGWVSDNVGLSGASIVEVLYDTRAPGVVYAAG